MDGLVDGLKDDRYRQIEKAPDADDGCRAEMGDVVLLVAMQRDRLDQRDMDLVSDRNRAREIGATAAGLLRHGEERRNRIAGMGVVGGKKRVVEIELAHGSGI